MRLQPWILIEFKYIAFLRDIYDGWGKTCRYAAMATL